MVGTIRAQIGSVKLKAPIREDRTINDLIKWMEKALPNSLARVSRKKGPAFDAWIESMVNTGESNLAEAGDTLVTYGEPDQEDAPF